MHYQSFSTDEFIQDEYFQQWVSSPTVESNRFWKAFQKENPDKVEAIADAREFLLLMKAQDSVPPSALTGIKSRLNDQIDEFESKGKIKQLHPHDEEKIAPPALTKWLKYSAAACVSLLICFLLYKTVPHGKDLFLEKPALESHEAPRGQQQYLDLPDGTKVWLNAESKISYPKDFLASAIREVYLEGEAFFDVAEDRQIPFVVNTSEVSIKVLGTAFNVKSYKEDNIIETTLVRGKITLEARNKPASGSQVTLAPNQQAVFVKNSQEILFEDHVDSNQYTSWKNGWIILDNKPFYEIKEILERWYNASISIEDQRSLHCTFSAKFKDKTLKEVLEIFKNTGSIDYEISGNQVKITGKLCDESI